MRSAMGFGGSSANLYDYANQNAVNMGDNEGKVVVVFVPVIVWAWRIVGFYDLYKTITNPCMDPYDVLIGQIPFGRMFKNVKYVKKIMPDPPKGDGPFKKRNPPDPPKKCGSGNSFTGDTLVHIWDEAIQAANTKPIADIRVGDKVLSYAEWEQDQTKALRYEVVEDVISSHQAQEIVTITLDNDETIRATAEHPFKTDDGWRSAALLEVGSQINSIVRKSGETISSGTNKNAGIHEGSYGHSVEKMKALSVRDGARVSRFKSSTFGVAMAALMMVGGANAPTTISDHIQSHQVKSTESVVDLVCDASQANLVSTIQMESAETAYRKVIRVTRDTSVIPVFNLEVASAHTFFVGGEGVLAHNGRPPDFTPPGGGRRGAFREAKRRCGIPVCQQPDSQGPNTDRRGNRQPGRTYNFGKCQIRDDAGGHDFGEGNDQNRGPHFNDPSGNHFDY